TGHAAARPVQAGDKTQHDRVFTDAEDDRDRHGRSFGRLGTSDHASPVTLPPGRFSLATRPNMTGSSLTPKTIGMVRVAALAAWAPAIKPGVAITATRRRTRSATSDGRRSPPGVSKPRTGSSHSGPGLRTG